MNALTSRVYAQLRDLFEALRYGEAVRAVVFMPELPKTATGKIQRFKLRG